MPKDSQKQLKVATLSCENGMLSLTSSRTASMALQTSSTLISKSSTIRAAFAASTKGKEKEQSDCNAEKTNGIGSELSLARLNALEAEMMGKSWYEVMNGQGEFQKPYFRKLKDFLKAEVGSQKVFPPLDNVYSWTRLTPLDEVRVIVLGQDPYHNDGQAHGLSFSVLPPTPLPGSLKNIYKQLANDVPSFVPPKSGDLTPLARDGILWLNAVLTVRAHQANSHKGKGWELFTAEAIKTVLKWREAEGKGVVIMAWGLPAQKTCVQVGVNEKKHLVLRSAHPSPLSAHRGFLGNGHFRLANEWLEERYGKEGTINWKAICPQ